MNNNSNIFINNNSYNLYNNFRATANEKNETNEKLYGSRILNCSSKTVCDWG